MFDFYAALSADGQLKAITLLGAAVAFAVGFLQYLRAQHWKRAEWISHEMETFFDDPSVRSGLQMIDWNVRRVQLYPHREEWDARFVKVSDDIVARALMSHDDRPEGFSSDETQIRDIFDRLLDRLERIHSFVEAGLVGISDVSSYLTYWADRILAAKAGDPKVDRVVQLRRFIERYRYTGVRRLLRLLTEPWWKFPQFRRPRPVA